jgi:hypothetical protein
MMVDAIAYSWRRVPTLAQRWDDLNGRPSDFDYLRIGLAIAVLVWHTAGVVNGSLWTIPY